MELSEKELAMEALRQKLITFNGDGKCQVLKRMLMQYHRHRLQPNAHGTFSQVIHICYFLALK